ncbi:hypothetical protein TNCV_509171 [Trichonephila clavipes]|nr:hypothetical protein TNCV_509171 [Trichonephila clavipes]
MCDKFIPKFLIATHPFLVQTTNEVVLSPPRTATSPGNITILIWDGGLLRKPYAQQHPASNSSFQGRKYFKKPFSSYVLRLLAHSLFELPFEAVLNLRPRAGKQTCLRDTQGKIEQAQYVKCRVG